MSTTPGMSTHPTIEVDVLTSLTRQLLPRSTLAGRNAHVRAVVPAKSHALGTVETTR